MSPGRSLRAAVAAALPVIALCAPFGLTASAGAAERRAAPDPCAAHGAGFAPLPGTTTCVRIGGRMRVEFGVSQGGLSQWRVAPQAGAASGASMPHYAAPGAGAAEHRLRPARNY